jgi:hypothetical protein
MDQHPKGIEHDLSVNIRMEAFRSVEQVAAHLVNRREGVRPVHRDLLSTPEMPGRTCGSEGGAAATITIQFPVYPLLPRLDVGRDTARRRRAENGPELPELPEVIFEFICLEQMTETLVEFAIKHQGSEVRDIGVIDPSHTRGPAI